MFKKLIFLGDSHTPSSMRNRLEKAPHRPAPETQMEFLWAARSPLL